MKNDVYTLFEEDESRSLEEQLALLAEISQSFSSTLNISQTLNIAIERFLEYLNAEAASIFLLDADSQELVCAECAGPVNITGLRLSSNKGIVGKTVMTRSIQVIRDVQSDPDFTRKIDAASGFSTRSILCVPLIINNEYIGALELLNNKNDDLFGDQDKHLSMALAS